MSTSYETRVAADDGVRGPAIPPRESSKRGSLLVEGASKTDGVVDLTNTVHTTIHTRQLPAVVHEFVTPTVHHIREEKITREIHNHDVFHRIQPVIDVEILPTKHFIQNADGSLEEIPASAIPGRQNHWHIATGPGPGSESSLTSDLRLASSRPSEPLPSSFSRHPSHLNPTKISHHTVPSSDGVHRTETTWRHPARILAARNEDKENILSAEDGNYKYGPLSSEEEPQARSFGFGNNGNLPGLKQPGPLTVPRSPSTTSDSISAAKAAMGHAPNPLSQDETQLSANGVGKTSSNRVIDVERRMEGLNVRE